MSKPIVNTLKSWIQIPENSDFSLHNLPYGVFTSADGSISCATRIGDTVINLDKLNKFGYLSELNLPIDLFSKGSLNPLISMGLDKWKSLRTRLLFLFRDSTTDLKNTAADRNAICLPINQVTMIVPITIGDYTDFYSSKEHAINVGKMFRPEESPLKPNWAHMPIAYHGRSSTILATNQEIRRPHGQIMDSNSSHPILSQTRKLDIELEMGFITGDANVIGEPVSVNNAHEHIFGMVLLNDWSARDIQKWEYVPLGPFLGKNFATSISPWIVTMEALEPFKTSLPKKISRPLPYLYKDQDVTYDIKLEVDIVANSKATNIIRSNYRYLYWSMSQQLAHHTINGCKVNAGDLMGSGTISGPDKSSYGSLLELSWAGTQPISLSDGQERTFLKDFDTVVMRGYCEKHGVRIGFGELSNQIVPGLKLQDTSSED